MTLHSRQDRFVTVIFAGILGCSSGGSGTPASASEPASPGTGSSSGSINGRAFDVIASAWLIGTPDDPAQTRVLQLFDKPVRCSDIGSTGWDTSVADGTQVLEIKLVGARPSTYPIAADGRPGTGQADVNYTLTSTKGTPSEIGARAGEVVLTVLMDGVSAGGTFDLTFPGGSVSGDFQAQFCAHGREP